MSVMDYYIMYRERNIERKGFQRMIRAIEEDKYFWSATTVGYISEKQSII